MSTGEIDIRAYLELVGESMRLVLAVSLLHFRNVHSQVGSSYLRVSTGHRLQYSIMDECELILQCHVNKGSITIATISSKG